MKNIIHYLLLIILTWSFTSCGEDWLDEPKSSQPSVEDLQSGSASLDGMLVGSYSQGLHELTYIGYYHLWELVGDMVAPTAKMNSSATSDERMTYRRELFNVTWGLMGRFTQYSARAINMCNIVLDACEKDLPKDANYAAQKDRLMGEALFLRSMLQFHYTLMHGRQWDPNDLQSNSRQNYVMMRTKPIFGTADIPLRRSTMQETYDILISSLKKAIELLPEEYDTDKHPATFQVRGNRNAAKFMLARVYFQQSDFANLKPLLADMLGNTPGQSPKFPLSTDMADLYERTNTSHLSGDEVIFEYFQTGTNTFNRSGKQLDNNVIKQLKDVNMRYSFQFQDSAAYEPGDKRFYELIYVYKDGIPQNQLTYADAEILDATSDPEDFKGRYWSARKYKLNCNVPLFRSAELVLMRAEMAAIEKRDADALADVNYIRKSRGLTADLTTADGNVHSMVIRERVRELNMEGNRPWDLLRRGALTQGKVKLWAGERQPVLSDCYDGKVVVEWDATQLQYPLIEGERNQNPLWNE